MIMNEILEKCKNINELTLVGYSLSYRIDQICSNLKVVSYLELNFHDLNNDHLKAITNSLKCLNSLFVTSENNIDDGLI